MSSFVRHTLWSWFPAAGITLGRHIFIKAEFKDDHLILAHELVHFRQQLEHPIWFWVSYVLLLPLFWNPFRAKWEAEAYAKQAQAGCPIDGDHNLAAQLAGITYGWPCRRAKAAMLIRSFMACLLLALAGPAAAADYSRVEVEQVLGQAVDSFDPVATLGLPYAPGSVAVSYVVDERPSWAQVAARAPRRLLTTVIYDRNGNLVAARQQLLGQLEAPVGEVTDSLKKVLQRRRT